MQLELIGSGDAYDGTRTNAALLVSAAHFSLLIDCGPTVPAALFRRGGSPEELDAVYLTHNHPDHVLGLTTLLNWMASQGRSKPLQLICQQIWPLVTMERIKHAELTGYRDFNHPAQLSSQRHFTQLRHMLLQRHFTAG